VKRRLLRALLGLGAVLVLAGGAGGAYVGARLSASLPLVDGERRLAGLEAPVRVERDALGVPVIRGATRTDVARAMGFVHAQERFFQMDLLRRRSAGELAELVGAAAVPADREVRVLQLRAVARRAVAALPADERALLQAYTEGVAAGLGGLAKPPFEYLLLRTEPSPWQPEDALLCALTMYLSLQGELPGQESTLGLMHDALPEALFEFLGPKGSEWDAPLEGAPFRQPAVPGPEVVDVRRHGAPAASPSAALEPPAPADGLGIAALARGFDGEWPSLGSNNWAVGASHTRDGAAIVANDMHLGISVPNTWYRASLVFQEDGAPWRVTGVTLPGAPFVIVGSNGRVAWGFTNSQGDWADLVVLETDPKDPETYRTPQGPRRLEHASETVRVKGGASETVEVAKTIWGPVVDKDHAGRRRALAWVALREGGLNAALVRMEGARSLAEAQSIAPECGIPNQNFTAGDADGHVGWTIIGRVPRRFGHDGRLPVSWADGASGWDGWLPGADYPRIVDPPLGRIWTANARVVDGPNLAKVGFGGYDLGARQGQIRDDLLAIDRASEEDMLRVQLDDRARFLERWQGRLLELLTPEATAGKPLRAEARALVERWGGRAAVDSAGYRIVRAFRLAVAADAFAPLLAPCREKDARFDYLGTRDNRGHRQWEGPLWALLSEKPAHLLDPRFASWEELQLAALDATLAELTKRGARLAERTWGERNTTLVQHPLSRAVPALARLLDMPYEPLPGDSHMPRFQSPQAGASERLAVSPGHEERGYFHMPTGQSGHPRSPHYADGHAAWARGEATPFLPGPAVSVLTLVPAR
jgi:penicillin amidase